LSHQRFSEILLGKKCPKPVKVDPKTTIAGTPKNAPRQMTAFCMPNNIGNTTPLKRASFN
jgi:hypothetical protein